MFAHVCCLDNLTYETHDQRPKRDITLKAKNRYSHGFCARVLIVCSTLCFGWENNETMKTRNNGDDDDNNENEMIINGSNPR